MIFLTGKAPQLIISPLHQQPVRSRGNTGTHDLNSAYLGIRYKQCDSGYMTAIPTGNWHDVGFIGDICDRGLPGTAEAPAPQNGAGTAATSPGPGSNL